MKALKRKVCKYEKKWLKYKAILSVGGLQEGKKTHILVYLNIKKKTTIQDKIQECTKDS